VSCARQEAGATKGIRGSEGSSIRGQQLVKEKGTSSCRKGEQKKIEQIKRTTKKASQLKKKRNNDG